MKADVCAPRNHSQPLLSAPACAPNYRSQDWLRAQGPMKSPGEFNVLTKHEHLSYRHQQMETEPCWEGSLHLRAFPIQSLTQAYTD